MTNQGEKIIVKHDIAHKVPLVGQLVSPDDRLYFNGKEDKPKRKLTSLPVAFGKITKHN